MQASRCGKQALEQVSHLLGPTGLLRFKNEALTSLFFRIHTLIRYPELPFDQFFAVVVKYLPEVKEVRRAEVDPSFSLS